MRTISVLAALSLPTGSITLASLPVGVLVALGVLLVIELALDVIALVDLYRRPIDRVALGNKWVWVVIIILINLLGSILYLAVGRRPAPVPQETAARTPGVGPASPGTIADALYGERTEQDER